MKYFDVRDVINEVPDANIYMFIGERSNGKTHSALSYGLDKFDEDGSHFVYVRRLAESLKTQYMRNLFNGNKKSGDLRQHLNKHGYLDVAFYSSAFWAVVEDENGKRIRTGEPIAFTQAISTWETGKGGTFIDTETIIFDEFLTRGSYLPDEPVLFENLISSIFREEGKGKVLMLANTVSWQCPYFREWGLNHVREMEQGTYDTYQTGDGRRKIVVCYTEHAGPKASDVFFNYDNPRSRMIMSGVWETAEYPPIPTQVGDWYKGESCYIQSIDGWAVRVQPMATPDGMECLVIYNSNKTPITKDGVDVRFVDKVIYTDYFFPYMNCRMALTKHHDKYSKFLIECFRTGRVFYQNNEVGENIRNYLKFSTAYTPIPN